MDREVENALLKRALGYTYEEVTVEKQQVSEDDDFQDVETKGLSDKSHLIQLRHLLVKE